LRAAKFGDYTVLDKGANHRRGAAQGQRDRTRFGKVNSQTILDFVNEVVSNKVSLLTTDQWKGYSDYLTRFNQATVDHSKHQYVVGAVHTNTIEGLWSIFKRGVVGTFHKMAPNICRCTLPSFSSGITTASIQICSEWR
jgi:hypothetical protein